MATKPTERILDWSSTGTNTDPGGAKEAAGWLVAERPPAYWWNWILNSFGKWLSWAETSIDDLETDTAHVPFAGCKITTNGSGGHTLYGDFNISSVTVGSGDITFNFTTAFPNANYTWQVSSAGSNTDKFYEGGTTTTTSMKIVCETSAEATINPSTTVVGFCIDIFK